MLLRLDDIHRSFLSYGQALPVLAGIQLELEAGERLALRGASGSGKSTLLGVIGLIDTGYEGSYSFDGQDVSGLDEEQRSQLRLERIGLALQAPHFLPTLTLRDNVALPAMAHGLPGNEAKQRAEELLESLGLEHRTLEQPQVLSGGEKRRASLARALINDPDLVLLDEPEAGLDPASRDRMLEVLGEETGEAVAWILVTHDERFEALCQRTLALDEGRLVEQAPA